MEQGERLGSYRILRRLGAGAMGEVWLAEHEMLRKRRALKVLPRALAASPGFRDRFLAEGRVLATLEHPNIVQVHDMQVEGDTHFIAMDFVSPDGERSESLDDLLSTRGGRFPGAEVAAILGQICEAMEYAHGMGIIHRDLKPSNVLVGPKGVVRVSDFGLAKVIGEKYLRESISGSLSGKMPAQREKSFGSEESVLEGSSATSEALSLVGTYHYMPPEVQEGGEWTRQGDIYSLGVLTYVLLVGKRPVGRFKNPSQVVQGLSPVWDSLISRALDDDPAGRFRSASEMLDALSSIGDGAHVSRAKPTHAKIAAWLVVALLAAVVGIAGGLMFSRQRLQPSSIVPEHTPGSTVTAGITPVVAPPTPVAVPPTSTAAPTPDDSALKRLAQETRRKEEQLERAQEAYAVAESVDKSDATTPGKKMEAWNDYLSNYRSFGVKVSEAESRVSHWKEEVEHSNYIEAHADLGLEMVWIKPGSFEMGSPDDEKDRISDEGPVHRVELEGFWLGKYEITQAQYEKLMGKNTAQVKGANNPVDQVSWNDAVAFCDKLSQATGRKYMLPSESQWEYACRAGSTGAYCFGNSEADLGRYAWYSGNSGGMTHPVGKKEPNAWGLHDMHGNVWEWCQDSFHSNYDGAPTDGSVWVNPSESRRVLRGGNWYCNPRNCRSAYRYFYFPVVRLNSFGFRLSRIQK